MKRRRRIPRFKTYDCATSVDGHEYAAARSFPLSMKLDSKSSPLSEGGESLSRDVTIQINHKSSYGIKSGAVIAFSSGDDIDDLKCLINQSPHIN